MQYDKIDKMDKTDKTVCSLIIDGLTLIFTRNTVPDRKKSEY